MLQYKLPLLNDASMVILLTEVEDEVNNEI